MKYTEPKPINLTPWCDASGFDRDAPRTEECNWCFSAISERQSDPRTDERKDVPQTQGQTPLLILREKDTRIFVR